MQWSLLAKHSQPRVIENHFHWEIYLSNWRSSINSRASTWWCFFHLSMTTKTPRTRGISEFAQINLSRLLSETQRHYYRPICGTPATINTRLLYNVSDCFTPFTCWRIKRFLYCANASRKPVLRSDPQHKSDVRFNESLSQFAKTFVYSRIKNTGLDNYQELLVSASHFTTKSLYPWWTLTLLSWRLPKFQRHSEKRKTKLTVRMKVHRFYINSPTAIVTRAWDRLFFLSKSRGKSSLFEELLALNLTVYSDKNSCVYNRVNNIDWYNKLNKSIKIIDGTSNCMGAAIINMYRFKNASCILETILPLKVYSSSLLSMAGISVMSGVRLNVLSPSTVH